MQQQTIAREFEIEGIGLHSGLKSKMVFKPMPVNSGIVFCRSDVDGKPQIPALWSNVVDTRNCTCLGDKDKNIVSTIEHLMGALYARGVDNALVEVSNPELPIMDGSAKVFYDILQDLPLREQKAPRRFLKILKEVCFADDKGNSVTLKPAEKGLHIKFDIEFPSKIVGHQEFDRDISEDVFVSDCDKERTYIVDYTHPFYCRNNNEQERQE